MVKQGYKQTEIGVIPEDWDVKYLNDFGDVVSGGTPSTSVGEYWDGDIVWCTPSDITSTKGKYIFKTDRNISYQGLKNSAATVLPSKSILLCTRATIGELKLSGVPMATNQGFKNLHPNATANVDYLYYLLQTKKKDMVELAIGSTFLEISKKALCSIALQTPSLPEQKRIAEALSDVDGMISSLEKMIAKKKAVKQGAMQKLLTGKKRLPGFDGEWKSMSLGEIGVITGSGVDKKILPDELPITLLNYTNVYHQVSISRKDLNHQVTASAEKIKNCSVLKGDVFLTPTSETPEEIAISAVAIENMLDVVYSYHVVRLRPNTCYDGAFINYALSTPMFREQAVQFAEGSGIRYVITLKKFKEMQLYIPADKAEQEAIVFILSDMDNEIEALEQKLAKTRQIKQGMMQQLLTGKIRLV